MVFGIQLLVSSSFSLSFHPIVWDGRMEVLYPSLPPSTPVEGGSIHAPSRGRGSRGESPGWVALRTWTKDRANQERVVGE